MDDIIGQGDDPEPGRGAGRRRLLMAAALIAVVAIIVVEHAPNGRHARPRIGSARITRGLRRSGAEPSALARPIGVVGPTATFSGRIELPRTGIRPSWFWPATGRVQVIDGLPANDSGYTFTRLNGGWAVSPAAVEPATCGGCIGIPPPAYYLADGARSARRVGIADQIAPAVGAGVMWLTTFPTSADPNGVGGTAREVSATGRAVVSALRLPPGYEIDQATSRGLLLAPIIRGVGPARYELWPPGAVPRTFTGVVAATAGAIAWSPPCAGTCPLYVLDLATGRETLVAPPIGNSVMNAVFSPDGRYLAFGAENGDLTLKLEVMRVRTGRIEPVPGRWASSDAMVGFGWPDDHELVAELSFTTEVQVVSWSPGAAKIAAAPARSDQDATALILR